MAELNPLLSGFTSEATVPNSKIEGWNKVHVPYLHSK